MPVLPSAIAIILVGGVLLYRRLDVRLVLMLGAVALYVLRATQPGLAGQRGNIFAALFVDFVKGMTNITFVVPICSAMGFAYACKATGCDAHLVHLLCRPLQKVRWLMVPGGVAVAFFVNSAIVSQTSTVSVVGPVLVPLVLAAGFSKETAGAMLLIGGSMGGELLNPVSVEVGATTEAMNQAGAAHHAALFDRIDIVEKIRSYDLAACGAALLAFWLFSLLRERAGRALARDDTLTPTAHGPLAGHLEPTVQEMMLTSSMALAEREQVVRINPTKAVVPLIPIVLLLFVKRYVFLPDVLRAGAANPIAEQATIAAAMLIGATVAALVSIRKAGRVVAAFCEGAGFAYGHVILLIVTAILFAKGVEQNNLIGQLTASVGHTPVIMAVAGIVVPWVMATVTGTAVGTAPAIIALLVPAGIGAAPGGHEMAAGMNVGAIGSVASQFGRTCSPVAPVTLMCAIISRCRATDLLRRIVPALLMGGAVLLIMGLLRR